MPNTNKHEQLFGISYNQVNFKPYHNTNCNHFFGKPTFEIINQ